VVLIPNAPTYKMTDAIYNPKKVSSKKSGAKKAGQKHQNTVAFHPNRNSRLTKEINNFPVSGLCEKCVEIVLWRKKFRKYRPLSIPKKW
jgi:hypothetical protein